LVLQEFKTAVRIKNRLLVAFEKNGKKNLKIYSAIALNFVFNTVNMKPL
jgi:hypothetical protein